jgi:hypothetical protein
MQSQLTARVQHRATARTLHRAKPQQSPVVARVGLFNFLKPKPAEAPVNNQRAQELVEELVDICKGTDAGAKASTARREQIAELVDELQQYCMKNPLKSNLLWGEYEVCCTLQPGCARPARPAQHSNCNCLPIQRCPLVDAAMPVVTFAALCMTSGQHA